MSSVTATAAPEAALHPALRDFYAEDARRAHSAERDLGLRWRSVDGSTYRAAWVEDTGELYSVRHGSPEDGHRVTVLARLSADALERELAGWREVCDSERPGSYEWLRERAAKAEAGIGPAQRERRWP